MKNFRFDIEKQFNKEMKDFTPEDYATFHLVPCHGHRGLGKESQHHRSPDG